MTRRLVLLNGLAIIAVVCNHAAGWGFTAMFWWTHRYRSVAVPNFDQVGSLPYYVLLLFKQLTVFSVPAFLFVSGVFIAYTMRGNQSLLNWTTIKHRLKFLLVPYLIWSIINFIIIFLVDGTTFALSEYLTKLLFGQATHGYFYVIVILQFYLLSPLIATIAKKHSRVILIVSALIQLLSLIIRYLSLPIFSKVTVLPQIQPLPSWFFSNWIFFFTFGVVAGFNIQSFGNWVQKVKWLLLIFFPIISILTFFEPELISQFLGSAGWMGSARTVSTSLYTITFILLFIAFFPYNFKFSKFISNIGNKSYGIYLTHGILLMFVSKLTYHAAPFILARQVLFVILLTIISISIILLLMNIIFRSKARRYYRFLFG